MYSESASQSYDFESCSKTKAMAVLFASNYVINVVVACNN